MEPHLFRIAPQAGSGESYTHEGEEFLYILRGELQISLEEEEYRLKPGDSFYFESATPHRWKNPGPRRNLGAVGEYAADVLVCGWQNHGRRLEESLDAVQGESRRVRLAHWLLLVAILAAASAGAGDGPSPVADTVIVNAPDLHRQCRSSPGRRRSRSAETRFSPWAARKRSPRIADQRRKVIDAGGQLVLPGFTDCHIHFLDGSLSLHAGRSGRRDRPSRKSRKRVKAFADAHPEQPWVLGTGLDLPDLRCRRSAGQEISGRNHSRPPGLSGGFDGQVVGQQQSAGAGGNHADTPDPAERRDSCAIRRRASPPALKGRCRRRGHGARYARALARGKLARLARWACRKPTASGWCGCTVAGGVDVRTAICRMLDLYDELRKKRRTDRALLHRVLAWIRRQLTARGNLQKIEDARSTYHDEWISGGAVKFYARWRDRIAHRRHARALQRRSQRRPANCSGIRRSTSRPSPNWTGAAFRFSLTPSATGRCAWRSTPTRTPQRSITPAMRVHRIEHIETISAQDIPRFGKLGVIASFQPLHAYPDDDTLKVWARNAGPERAQRGMGVAQHRERRRRAGFRQRLAGRDSESVARRAERADPADHGRRSSGRICSAESASAWKTPSRPTLWARRLPDIAKKPKARSSPAKLADLIVLSQDLFKIEPNQIAQDGSAADHGRRKSRLPIAGLDRQPQPQRRSK